jgi:hypothetical protein
MHDRGAGRKPARNSETPANDETIMIAADRYPKHSRACEPHSAKRDGHAAVHGVKRPAGAYGRNAGTLVERLLGLNEADAPVGGPLAPQIVAAPAAPAAQRVELAIQVLPPERRPRGRLPKIKPTAPAPIDASE